MLVRARVQDGVDPVERLWQLVPAPVQAEECKDVDVDDRI